MTPPTSLDRDKEAVMEAQSREAFEKWRKEHLHLFEPYEKYRECWQAALQQGVKDERERCAKALCACCSRDAPYEDGWHLIKSPGVKAYKVICYAKAIRSQSNG